MIVSRSVYMVRHTRGSYVGNSWLSLDMSTPEIILTVVDAVIRIQDTPPLNRFLVGCSSPFMRLVQHLTALRKAWCKKCLPGQPKTRSAPSRHCRDARVFGNTTTAMQDNEYTPPRAPPSPTYLSSQKYFYTHSSAYT